MACSSFFMFIIYVSVVRESFFQYRRDDLVDITFKPFFHVFQLGRYLYILRTVLHAFPAFHTEGSGAFLVSQRCTHDVFLESCYIAVDITVLITSE